MSKKPQTPPQKAGSVVENRAQSTKPVAGGAKASPQPRSQADASSKLVGTDREKARVAQPLDPPRRLEMPSELDEPTAHGHSPQIDWPKVDVSLPWKGLK